MADHRLLDPAARLRYAREAKGLLIGERADPQVVETVRDIIARHPAVTAVNHVRTIHTAPDSIFVAISADFAFASTALWSQAGDLIATGGAAYVVG